MKYQILVRVTDVDYCEILRQTLDLPNGIEEQLADTKRGVHIFIDLVKIDSQSHVVLLGV